MVGFGKRWLAALAETRFSTGLGTSVTAINVDPYSESSFDCEYVSFYTA